MQAFITILLVLTTIKMSYAQPKMIYSQVCNYDYAEGTKTRRATGQVVRACLHKASLGDDYLTDSETNCAQGFAAGIRAEIAGEFEAKICLKIESLGEVYETDKDEACINGYSTDGLTLYGNTSKYCVRHF